MAGDSNTGGGGSVHWHVKANYDDQDVSTCNVESDGHYHQRGRDPEGAYGQPFTISIKIPSDAGAKSAFLGLWKDAGSLTKGDRVVFTIPIEDDAKQINVQWGNQDNLAMRGNLAVKHRQVLARKSASAAMAKKRSGKKASVKKPAAKKGKAKARGAKRR